MNARRVPLILAVLATLASAAPASAQTFDSTSNGSDGALVLNRPDPDPNPNQPFVIEFDPDDFDPPLDADRDNIYHFTTITIGADVTVRLAARRLNGPVYWLAQGNVAIDGTIDLNGQRGYDESEVVINSVYRVVSRAGAGGFGGGIGGILDATPSDGLGPGKGRRINRGGGGAGHATEGGHEGGNTCGSTPDPGLGGGAMYGSEFLVPLLGGSGGAGGSFKAVSPAEPFENAGGGGGAGGGAILIASSASIDVEGSITANGGRGGDTGYWGGGGGSGGSIRLAAPTIRGAGVLSATGGARGDGIGSGSCGDGDGGTGAPGRIRLEAFDHQFTGAADPIPPRRAPIGVFLPEPQMRLLPVLRVTSVGGTPLLNPIASITSADIQTETRDPIEVVIEARNIPLGTVVNLRLISENAADQVLDSTPLAGTPALSTATVTIQALPPGFSRAFVRAEWSQE